MPARRPLAVAAVALATAAATACGSHVPPPRAAPVVRGAPVRPAARVVHHPRHVPRRTVTPVHVAAPAAPPAPAVPCPTTGAPARPVLAGFAAASRVAVYAAPGRDVTQVLANPMQDGGPLTFMVLAARPGWLYVQLPVRPNESAGWVSTHDVVTTTVGYRLDVFLAAHCLLVFSERGLVGRVPVADGAPGTPTPTGSYFLAALFQSPYPDGAYGPYAYGLSAYSDVLQDFGGGPGEIGLHGTDEPWSIGYSASHGCIRVTDAAIGWLAGFVPVGTPIVIHP